MSRYSRKEKHYREVSKKRSVSGSKGVEAKNTFMLERCEKHYTLERIHEIKDRNGVLLTTWKIYATGDPSAPLAIDFGGKAHRYMSGARLNAMLKRQFHLLALNKNSGSAMETNNDRLR